MTVTDSSTYRPRILPHVLHDVPMRALTPKVVLYGLINHDTIDGEPSDKKEYSEQSYLEPAGPALEGVDFTDVTSLDYEANIDMVPTEAAVARADITTKAIRRKLPGESNSALFDRIMAGDYHGLLGMLEDEATRLMKTMWERVERDIAAQLDDFTDSVGDGSDPLSTANTIQALYEYEANDPEHEDCIWVWDPQQLRNIRAELLDTSGATAASWFREADQGMINALPDTERSGFRGTYLGYPVYAPSVKVNPKPDGTKVAGALMARGRGVPERDQTGAINFLEGHPPDFLLDVKPTARTIALIGVWEYATTIIRNAHGCSLITKGPA